MKTRGLDWLEIDGFEELQVNSPAHDFCPPGKMQPEAGFKGSKNQKRVRFVLETVDFKPNEQP